MGRENYAKGDAKTKQKGSKLRDRERAGSGGDLTTNRDSASDRSSNHHAEAERPGQPRPTHCPIDPQRR
ncbi:hypothetical protein ILYODFUR_018996 [Ilyodon furcidens]|uniref:Uncharacterized protein n=1 Tax=Ilyodon furcidens TaxID=33524 RepID=A0ABV0UHB0_9TELE